MQHSEYLINICALVANGKYIQAIRLRREETGEELKEAKAAIDGIRLLMPKPTPDTSRIVSDLNTDNLALSAENQGLRDIGNALDAQYTKLNCKMTMLKVELNDAREMVRTKAHQVDLLRGIIVEIIH